MEDINNKYTTHQVTNSQSQPTRFANNGMTQQSKDSEGYFNYHQGQNGKLLLSERGHPRCNYCSIPSHKREVCRFRLAGIRRAHHPDSGNLQSRRQQKQPTSAIEPWGQNQSHWYTPPLEGHDNYHLAPNGTLLLSSRGHPMCNCCGIPSHKREACRFRARDVGENLIRTHHMDWGHLQPVDSKKRLAAVTLTNLEEATYSSREEINLEHRYDLNKYRNRTARSEPLCLEQFWGL